MISNPWIALCFLASGPHDAPPRYRLTDLGTLGGKSSYSIAVNAKGQVLGRSSRNQRDSGPAVFLYSGGRLIDVSAWTGRPFLWAFALNDSGRITGCTEDPEKADPAHNTPFKLNRTPIICEGGKMTVLPKGGSESALPAAINNAGQIAMNILGGHPYQYRPYVCANGNLTLIGTRGFAESTACAISSSGDVVLGATPPGTHMGHVVLYSKEETTDLGCMGGYDAVPCGINREDEIVGWLKKPSKSRAFLYSKGNVTVIDTLGGKENSANAINDSGDVVGWSDIAVAMGRNAPLYHGFLYRHRKLYDLNSLVAGDAGGFTISLACSISSNGFIAGTGVAPDGNDHAFLLTPMK